jgi:hypothetical protein
MHSQLSHCKRSEARHECVPRRYSLGNMHLSVQRRRVPCLSVSVSVEAELPLSRYLSGWKTVGNARMNICLPEDATSLGHSS